ncbi:hypothetical protein NEOKW01_0991 [Nematocida sp. AWRm80]|nr:hypothetical protein NEOKW01_0991 [Nematocida sp. AWRm80]
MCETEEALNECISRIDRSIERITIVEKILDQLLSIHTLNPYQKTLDKQEEYFIEEINRWIKFSEAQIKIKNTVQQMQAQGEIKYLKLLKETKHKNIQTPTC